MLPCSKQLKDGQECWKSLINIRQWAKYNSCSIYSKRNSSCYWSQSKIYLVRCGCLMILLKVFTPHAHNSSVLLGKGMWRLNTIDLIELVGWKHNNVPHELHHCEQEHCKKEKQQINRSFYNNQILQIIKHFGMND